MVLDTLGWQYAFIRAAAPFHKEKVDVALRAYYRTQWRRLVPGSLGAFEGANAAAFAALGLGASIGLAYSLVRRARQLVCIGIGVIILVAMPSTGRAAGRRAAGADPGRRVA